MPTSTTFAAAYTIALIVYAALIITFGAAKGTVIAGTLVVSCLVGWLAYDVVMLL